MTHQESRDDLPARAAYQASCEARGVKPNWGRNGYQAQAARWRTIAEAAANPTEPPVSEKKPKKAIRQVSQDLHDIQIPMSQAILVVANLLEIDDKDMSRFTGHVKHFQRNGFPKGMHTGRGSPAVLDRERLLQLAVCATLHRAGMTPIPAMAATEDAWEAIRPAIIRHLIEEAQTPMTLAVVADGPHDRSVTVQDVESALKLVHSGGIRSVTIHRLDILATSLREAVHNVVTF